MAYPYMGQAGGAGPGQVGSPGALIAPWLAPQYSPPPQSNPAAGAALLPGRVQLRPSGG